ncbi:hypothetical protein D3C72_2278560 [compost metagenome]
MRGQDDGHEQGGVQKVARKGRRFPGIAEVLQGPGGGQVEPDGVVAGMEGRPERVGERQYPQQGQQPGGQGVEPGMAVDHGRCGVHL